MWGQNKYGAIRTEVDGQWFDSKAEAKRYQELKIMVRAGIVKNLQVHERFAIIVGGKTVGQYEADFTYYENGKQVVEDVKGVKTDVYKLKKKLLLFRYPFCVFRET